MNRLDQIQRRLLEIPAETERLTKELAGILAEQASLAAELNQHHSSFDMVRISQAKREVGFSDTTIRAFAREGLRLYRPSPTQTLFSKTELKDFILKRAELKERA